MTDLRPGRRWPVGLAGMLGIVLLVEVGLDMAGWSLVSYDTVVRRQWRRASHDASGEAAVRAEVLCFGDSLVKTGVVPAAIEARLDRPAYNLAAFGAPTPGAYFLFRRALAAGARPRALVFNASEAQLWVSGPREKVVTWSYLLGPAEALALASDDGDPGFLGPYLLHYLLPSVRHRQEFRRAALGLLAGRLPGLDGHQARVTDRQHEANLGAILFQPTHPKDGPDHRPGGVLAPDEAAFWYTPDWTARPSSLLYLERFLALAGDRGIPVFLLVPPIHPAVEAERRRRGVDRTYEALLRDVLARHPHVVVVDGRRAGFAHGAFVDACHMNVDGALAMSQGLAEVMAARLDAPTPGGDRWVPLPPFVEPTARLAVEDWGDSMRALRSASRPR